MSYQLILRGGTLLTHKGECEGDVAIRDGRIAEIGSFGEGAADEVIDCAGLHILPGVIDTQVHFREPGNEHKENLESGSRAAIMGGVVAVFEMPNTAPPTTSVDALEDKLRRAENNMHCDYAFYAGGTPDNAELLPEMERLAGCCGVKVFMGSSTGDLLVPDDENVGKIIRHITRRAAFHSEDEFLLRKQVHLAEKGNVNSHPVWRDEQVAFSCTKRLLALAEKEQKQIHVLHVTTKSEMELLAKHRSIASVEVTPQHLTLAAPECYDELGSFAQMNPPIREAKHREALWRALSAGIVDVIGSDHAPHSREEKAADYPKSPAGMPGVQTLLPLMLEHVHAKRLSRQRLVELTSLNAHRLFKLANKGKMEKGFDADFTLVDFAAKKVISEDWLQSKCGWSPFTGKEVHGWPIATIIRGNIVMREGELIAPSLGKPIEFMS
ncbi:MAG: dihydroorotase [Parvibaculales bacterium]